MDALEDEVRRARHFFGVRKVLFRDQLPLPEVGHMGTGPSNSHWLSAIGIVV